MGKIIPKLHLILFIVLFFSIVPSSFSQASKANKQAQIYRERGYSAQNSGNLDMALGYYQMAVQLDPYYALAYNDIGVLLEAKGMFKQAKELYVKAVSLDPNCLSAYYNLAALYEKEGEVDKASYYWKMRVYLGDWSDIWTWRANEHFENLGGSGQVVTSGIPIVGNLGLRLKPDPVNDAKYHLYRGRQYLLMGNYAVALKEFTAARTLDPDNNEIEELIESTQRKVFLYN